jgi:hypothetical protein
MTKRIPTAIEMERSKQVLLFQDFSDEREVIRVHVELLPNGEWAAGDDNADGEMPGRGDTMLEALADLKAQMEEI